MKELLKFLNSKRVAQILMSDFFFDISPFIAQFTTKTFEMSFIDLIAALFSYNIKLTPGQSDVGGKSR